MQCSICGNELGAQALFCGKCGTPVAGDAPADDTLEIKGVAARRRAHGAQAAEVTAAASDAASSRASFKGAMDTSHRKARRKMPVLVLMAVFMLAASTVAWAVYTYLNPPLANEREIDWTPAAVYEAMEPERFDLDSMLEQLLAQAREPSVPVKVPASIARAEGDRLNFVVTDEDDPRMIIYYRAASSERTPDSNVLRSLRGIESER